MKSQSVLIVDDDRRIAEGVSVRLRAAGYETLIADDGLEGVSAAREQRPDAIVLDVRMPKLDGLSALAQLKTLKDTENTPVIMLSASVVDETAALDGGASFFIRKPFAGHELVDAVNAVLHEAILQIEDT